MPARPASLSAEHRSAGEPDAGLRLEGVSFAYDPAKLPADALFSGFSMTACAGKVTAVLGRSGGGKSTILNLIAGSLQPSAGSIDFSGEALVHLRERGRISYLNQKPLLLPWLTVRQNMEKPATLIANRIEEDPLELLDWLGIPGTESAYPNTLSGGMYQRAALARALYVRPALLLLDEPFSALDEITRLDAYAVLRRLVEKYRICCLLVTHSIGEMFTAADRCLVLNGKPVRVMLDENLAETSDPASLRRAAIHEQILAVLQ